MFSRIKVLFNIFLCLMSVMADEQAGYFQNGQCVLPPELVEEIKNYQPIVDKIVDEIVRGKFAGETWKTLAELTDTFGARMSGSESLEKAIDYVIAHMQSAGLENVHAEKASVTYWTRGAESAELIAPIKRKLPILGLGGSVGTPKEGLQGDLVAVETFDEFASLPVEAVQGKIVLFVPKWERYNLTVVYRNKAAATAAKKGAIAALVRSITPFSIYTLHTGMQDYEEDVKEIPAAAITVEDAYILLRWYRNNQTVQVHMEMDDKNLGEVESRNTIGELQGTEKVNESVIVVSGHLDSWDVGVGAMDDGGGAMISWKAVEFLKQMNLRPKRTIRAILWTAEEQGTEGSEVYMLEHVNNEVKEFNFFMESDIGTFEPRGLDFTGNNDAACLVKEVLKLMTPLNATEFATPTDGGPDIDLWTNRGFPGSSLLTKNEKYFWFQHSGGDSMLVEDKGVLDKCTALWAAAAYVIADMSVDMPKDVVVSPKKDNRRKARF